MRSIDQRLPNCAKDGDLDGVVSALDAGADVNIQNEDGWTALMWAATYGHTETTDRLIQAGADVNIQSKDGWTALMWAARNGHTEMVDRLIQAGAALNIQDKDGWTVLMYATINRHMEIVDGLIQTGVDIFIKNKDGWTALDIAKKHNCLQTAELIEQQMAERKSTELARSTENVEVPDLSRWL